MLVKEKPSIFGYIISEHIPEVLTRSSIKKNTKLYGSRIQDILNAARLLYTNRVFKNNNEKSISFTELINYYVNPFRIKNRLKLQPYEQLSDKLLSELNEIGLSQQDLNDVLYEVLLKRSVADHDLLEGLHKLALEEVRGKFEEICGTIESKIKAFRKNDFDGEKDILSAVDELYCFYNTIGIDNGVTSNLVTSYYTSELKKHFMRTLCSTRTAKINEYKDEISSSTKESLNIVNLIGKLDDFKNYIENKIDKKHFTLSDKERLIYFLSPQNWY